MSKIPLVPDSIYFLQERDYLSGELFDHVNIGLVRNEKLTAERIEPFEF